jgi:hypothetical protein
MPDPHDGKPEQLADENSALVPVDFQPRMFSGAREGNVFPVQLGDRDPVSSRSIVYVTTTRTQEAHQ